jgi:hypothetical protein
LLFARDFVLGEQLHGDIAADERRKVRRGAQYKLGSG